MALPKPVTKLGRTRGGWLGVGRALIRRRDWLAIHRDAFRADPATYLAAAWWWLRRKRLRARHRLAPLLAASPLAYRIWLARQPLAERLPFDPSDPPIIALLDPRCGDVGFSDTLDDLARERIVALLLGGGTSSDRTAVIEQITAIGADTSWLLPMAPGDRLAIGAGDAYRVAIRRAGTMMPWLIYADDDLIGPSGLPEAPHFKPRWNAELFRHFDYISGTALVRADPSLLSLVGDGPDWAVRLMTAASLRPGPEPMHLGQMLHHRRNRPIPQIAVASAAPGSTPTVSVIIPIRNRAALLRNCLAGLERTDYRTFDIIVVDNDSDDTETLALLDALTERSIRVLRHPGPFNYSAINNHAAREASGEILCLLNNDIEVIEPGWMTAMAAQAVRPDVGAVGARLLYPDGRIQHAGVVIGMGNAAGHAHRFVGNHEEGYFQRHALPQFVSAVTGACLVVRRDRFLAVGGLDEQCFPVAYNDVDLCLRLNQRGWQSLYEPRATLIHHESVSRGLDRDPAGAARFARELAALQDRWGTADATDPFHHPQLCRASERFVLRF